MCEAGSKSPRPVPILPPALASVSAKAFAAVAPAPVFAPAVTTVPVFAQAVTTAPVFAPAGTTAPAFAPAVTSAPVFAPSSVLPQPLNHQLPITAFSWSGHPAAASDHYVNMLARSFLSPMLNQQSGMAALLQVSISVFVKIIMVLLMTCSYFSSTG